MDYTGFALDCEIVLAIGYTGFEAAFFESAVLSFFGLVSFEKRFGRLLPVRKDFANYTAVAVGETLDCCSTCDYHWEAARCRLP